MEDHAVVLVEIVDLVGVVGVDVVEIVMRRYPQMILMLIWTSTMKHQCKSTKGIHVYVEFQWLL